jgi:hypothetical protein
MKPETLSFAVLAICAALVCSTNAADAQTGLRPITARWWQWVLSIPADNNPTLDTTGQDCMVGQQGPIWFLTGANFGGETPHLTRSCSMPAGDVVFFPVISAFFFNTPNCLQGPENLTVKFMREQIEPFINSVQNMSVTVDGSPLKPLRVASTPFPVAIPADNVFNPDGCGTGVPFPSGVYSPSVADGYYVVLENLKPRPQPYDIHFHAEAESDVLGKTVQDVTYHLTVVSVLSK